MRVTKSSRRLDARPIAAQDMIADLLTTLHHLALRVWRSVALRTAVGLWTATRVVMLVLTWFGALFNATHSNLPDHHPSLTVYDFIYHWWIWDSGWYISIAKAGYTTHAEGSYFPLYPLLIHLGISISPQFDPLIVALVISNLCTLLAFIAIASLVNFDTGDATAARYALRALAAYPLALFLFAAYSEGVFLACAAWALLGARRGWWWVAIVAGGVSGLGATVWVGLGATAFLGIWSAASLVGVCP